ncbi:hypothetical protein IWQ60_001535 [Tieghemiomyces parasiticus]|uniref:P-loop containing nucleoside triphosphate hydrolase protein n=1 Tax=Tieghemiomyces parasiticus TaxID=78921 RepID=A0A9W8DY86_9FUNG|nr:hypothetical protein IWQ60_001535 [Tieghemiomyces parasiticus]
MTLRFFRRFSCGAPPPVAPDQPHPTPETSANFFSGIFYWWLNSLMRLGYKRPLETTDLYQLGRLESSDYLATSFTAAWAAEVAKPKPALWRALNHVFGFRFWLAGFLLLLYFGTQIASPLILQELTDFAAHSYLATHPSQNSDGLHARQATAPSTESPGQLKARLTYTLTDPPAWYGYVMMVTLFILQQIGTFLNQRHFHLCMVAGYGARGALVMAIYRKALVLSGRSRQIYSQGAIVNLMSTDCSRLDMIAGFLNLIWVAPIVLCLASGLLLWKLGVSALVGFGLMVLYLPLQHHFAKSLGRTRQGAVLLTDRRIKLTQQFFQGIRVVKLYAWEDSLTSGIYAVRRLECNLIRRLMMIRGALFTCGMVLPSFATIGSFIVYAALGNRLESGIVFASLALFNVLRTPFMLLPQLVAFYMDATVSLTRISQFLQAEEISTDHLLTGKGPDAVVVSGASFAWEVTSDDPVGPPPLGPPRGTVDPAKFTSLPRSLYTRILGKGRKSSDNDDDEHDAEKSAETGAPQIELTLTMDDNDMGNYEGKLDLADDRPCLHRLHFSIPPGQLVGIVGTVGSGKSSLLSAMVGELRCLAGTITISGSLAYCSQSAWIQNATLRDNVLFGRPYDRERYRRVLRACALVHDLDSLPHGDHTEIGERGISLSGGQKQRLNLARAVYADTDVVLLDDPLSAVDPHVGRHLFRRCIRGAMDGKTRLLVTHQLHFMPHVDYILHLDDGHIIEQGTYQELMNPGTAFSSLMAAYGGVPDDNHDLEDEVDDGHVMGAAKAEISMTEARHSGAETGSTTSAETPPPGYHHATMHLPIDSEDEDAVHSVRPPEMFSHADVSSSHLPAALITGSGNQSTVTIHTTRSLHPTGHASTTSLNGTGPPPPGLMQAEERATGAVTFANYLVYFNACGGWTCLLTVLFTVAGLQAFKVVTDTWLTFWIADSHTLTMGAYAGIYILWGLLQLLFGLALAWASAYFVVRGSLALHNAALERAARATMTFFDTTPLGRLLNRFSKDVDGVDNLLLEAWRSFLNQAVGLLATFLLIIVNFPIFLAPLVPMLAFYVWFAGYYRSTSREIKRLDSVSRSPLYAHFQETLSGLSTIRAYCAQARFIAKNQTLLEANNRAYYLTIVIQRWLAVRLETVANILTLFTALFAVVGRYSVSPSIVGLILSYALQTAAILSVCVRQAAEVENNMNAVERLEHYTTHLPTEAAAVIADRRPAADWPSHGQITFRNVHLRFRPGLPLVLNDLTFSTGPHEKIGIVGRTGAGKSSLVLALFRLVEVESGAILIDGTNVAHLGIQDLRERLAIIPQDPVVFEGTVRSNLDPTGQLGDAALWDVLGRTELKAWVAAQPGQLDVPLASDGENLSVGQRQLLCLARAMLRRSRIVVLDEATASVDLATDTILQKVIREDFTGCTVLTIAHRLNTVVDYDRILVIDAGAVAEFDTPRRLLEDPQSQLYAMVEETGPANAALLHATVRGEAPPSPEL